MTEQLDLTFPRARATDPITSHEAADKAEGLARAHSERIVRWLRAHPSGGIKDEIASGTSIDDVAVARRTKELETRGLARRAGYAMGPNGRRMTVWVAA